MNKKIAAIVVTFNRRELLCKNIDVTLSQTFKVDKIFVIDNNSTDDTRKYIPAHYDSNLVEIVALPENIGGAGGFAKGIEYAFKNGYDAVILMDDDGRPMDNDCFEQLLNNSKDYLDEPSLINSLVLSDGEKLSFGLGKLSTKTEVINASNGSNVLEGLVNPFNGTLVTKSLYELIGLPNKNFFIKGDEVDYYLRAIKAKAHIFTVINSHYFHPAPAGLKKKKFLRKELILYIESPQKEYYNVRNKTYSYIALGEKGEAKTYYRKAIVRILLCKCSKIKVWKAIKKGYRDGKIGALGKVDIK